MPIQPVRGIQTIEFSAAGGLKTGARLGDRGNRDRIGQNDALVGFLGDAEEGGQLCIRKRGSPRAELRLVRNQFAHFRAKNTVVTLVSGRKVELASDVAGNLADDPDLRGLHHLVGA